MNVRISAGWFYAALIIALSIVILRSLAVLTLGTLILFVGDKVVRPSVARACHSCGS